MKKPSQRLQTVLKLARLRQQRAAEQLGKTVQNVEAQQQQVQQLQQYQEDYSQSFKQYGSAPVSAAQLANYQRFFTDLEQVTETQQQRMVLAGDQQAKARERWQQQYSREKNLQKLVARKEQQEQQQADNKLQRELDDYKPVNIW
jgi:flagellar protein FliJ